MARVNWLQKFAQLYPYKLDGKIPVRVKQNLGRGKVLVETEDRRTFEMWFSDFKKRTLGEPKSILEQKPAVPRDILCPKCGHLNSGSTCERCFSDLDD